MQKILIPYGKQFIDHDDENEVKNSLRAKLITTGNYVSSFESAVIKKFLIKYPLIKSSVQRGKTSYNKRRYPRDSELDINKNIKSQFNLMRVSDNEKFPIFFYHKSVKYILKIFKDL